MGEKAFQDYYPDELSRCYGCGRLNEHGLKIKSYWDGQDAVAVLEPVHDRLHTRSRRSIVGKEVDEGGAVGREG